MQWPDRFEITLTTDTVIGIALMALVTLAMPLVFGIFTPDLPPHERGKSLRQRLGLERINPGLLLVAAVFWLLLFAHLYLGLLWQIWDLWFVTAPADAAQWRMAVTRLTASTAVLGAVVAFPVTMVRLGLTRKETRHAEDVLYSEKINEAARSLYATRVITRPVDGTMTDIHEDDIVRRNAAIDALEGLANERPEEAVRISRMLSVYVRELSREYPPEEVPEGIDPSEIGSWARSLRPARSDIYAAVLALGRMRQTHAEQFTKEQIDLRGANLQGMALSAETLCYSNALFQYAALQGADLSGAKLQGASLYKAKLQGAFLLRAELQDANLYKAKLQGAFLRRAELQGADLDEASLRGADLKWAQMQKANLSMAELQRADLRKVDLQGAYLRWAKMQEANLSMAELQRADLRKADLQGASLKWAQMQEANLSMAELQRADLSEVDLQGACLSSANLQGANLREAKLQGAEFDTAELHGANFTRAKLQGAYLCQAKFDVSTILTRASLDFACVSKVDFTDVAVSQAQIYSTFGDLSVTLPAGLTCPAHWRRQQAGNLAEFHMEWHAWQAEHGFDPDDPSTWDIKAEPPAAPEPSET